MSVFKRIFRYLRALIMGKLDEWEDPEIIINEAVREMRENQIKNRELAVQAITQKNNLQAEVDKQERLVADLESKAMRALQAGNRELAKQFLKEKSIVEQTLASMRQNLAAATEAAEKVKIAIKQEEERIRQRTAEALALKANMKQAQIAIKINQALDQFQLSDNENQWNVAKERIQNLQSRASAMAEVANSSIDAKLREMEMSQMDVEADRQLEELERKLSLGGSPAINYGASNVQQIQTVGGGAVNVSNGSSTAGESDIDRQLRELESRLGGNR
ncbi:MAG: PspA/IM30 family protein [Chloroherpetonaceae bacterium]|nr:PspA/IM30 family protein [Chthonomonadaceae bacterium]MDW8207729.1 PspA/IM30 family protein [Chloroherpetonaceae bacterium]